MKEETKYKDNFNFNPRGRNKYGESKITGDKTRKIFSISISTAKHLTLYAQEKKLTQGDIVDMALRKFFEENQAKD